MIFSVLSALSAFALRVVDGDTIAVNGQRLRLIGIDTPEIDHAQCPYERQLGERAKARLTAMLSGGYRIQYSGKIDRYGRPLVRLSVGGSDVGERLIREGLAREYRGRRRGWC